MLPDVRTEIPGPRSRALAARLRRAESRNVTFVDAEFPVFWESAEGVNVWDVDGNRFLDLTSAFAVASLGHNAPGPRAALLAQAERLIHAMGDVHPTEGKVRLCERLGELTFGRWLGQPGKVVLCGSGFEAVEAALKTALLFSKGKRPGVIAFTGAYHGLGYGALEVGGLPYFREPFRAQLKDFATLLPYPAGATADLEKLDAALRDTLGRRGGDRIGAILVEPAQGRGGEVFPPREFLPLLRTVCDAHGLLLIADEIYTGFNRTGALFACDHSGVVPDLICLGKALTGGFPLSACVGRAELMDTAWPESSGEALHTSTFLGHPLGCAMALAALEEHARPETAAGVARAGERLLAALRAVRSPKIKAVRGRGLMLGVELDAAGGGDLAVRVVKRALRDGVLLLAGGPAGNVLSFTPPFGLADDEIAFVGARLQEYLTFLSGSSS
ncbi:MAG: aminotransferase class III-fold pyridoxal phosphate-dependent enzyme [Verrucomicrobia bacterium]|nr:aminotransferase class III-fold pyridoxal phosphate-dependent enzyme [Verrucomicrobiota bacterium]